MAAAPHHMTYLHTNLYKQQNLRRYSSCANAATGVFYLILTSFGFLLHYYKGKWREID